LRYRLELEIEGFGLGMNSGSHTSPCSDVVEHVTGRLDESVVELRVLLCVYLNVTSGMLCFKLLPFATSSQNQLLAFELNLLEIAGHHQATSSS
jgi:hypothetical protein